jgi:sterol desaturase/sphingolipid hydroxylase (fatty acid hydroxylase superfamily)
MFVLVALLVGVPPEQFIAVVACTQLLESLAHANVRLSFGPLLGRLLVSPAYHRAHHAMFGAGETAGRGGAGGHNFAVLFPLWDMLGRTARFDAPLAPTGVRDQLEGRDYGRGFWAQQWLGLRRLAHALHPRIARNPRSSR